MQMSILLEGNVINDESNNTIYEGIWQFAKEKKTNLKFKHEILNNYIPKKIFDYLCFKSDFISNDELINIINDHKRYFNNDDILNTTDLSDYICIEKKHPLFGLYEGSFEIIPDSQDKVYEIYFIYSFIGYETIESFNDLPYEPNFTLSVLKITEQIVQSVLPFDFTNRDNINSQYNYDVKVEDKNINDISKLENNDTANVISLDNNNNSKEDNTINGNKSMHSSNKNVKENDYVIVYGFGCNAIGRFSIVGSYQTSTGILRCEKKYIFNKGSKKIRRYSIESIQQRENKKIEAALAYNKTMSTRPKVLNGLNFDNYFDVNAYSSTIDIQSPKKKKKLFAINNTFNSFRFDDRQFQNKTIEYIIDEDLHYRSAFLDDDTGEVYEGGWYNGFKHGNGICLFPDGTLYEGSWMLGKENGRGALMTGEREVIYVGEWLDGNLHGQGLYNFSNGDKYSGDWKEGLRHGKGEYICNNGCKYFGDWKENKRSGRGLFKWPDGSFYDGEWENDKRHGKGILELVSGFRYDGHWVNNYFDGKGVSIFPSGQEYRGTFKQGLREGRGSITFSEGAEYEGRFKDDRIDGHGTLKITEIVPGSLEGELMIPIQVQSDIKRIHIKAGFGDASH